jgi:ribonuclease Z
MELKYSNNNNSETFIKIKIGGQYYTLSGYSRAGQRTCILIDEFNIVCDMGYVNDKAYSYDNKLISHGHYDHIGGLHGDHCGRKLYNINKERLYIMPLQCIDPFKLVASGFSTMNCGLENVKIFNDLHLTKVIESENCINNYCNLIGSSKQCSEYYVKSFEMIHKVKSFGYIIYRKSEKLKLEYQELSKEELIKIKKEQTITMPVYTPLLGYTGDTTIQGVINNSDFLNIPLLLMECTGFAPEDKQFTIDGKHIHFDDIIENYKLFNNQKIILFHFSQQYHTVQQLMFYINKAPQELQDKIILFF